MAAPQGSVQLAIVGAGPAGLSAACVAAEHGLKVVVVDEFPVPGGRMLGQFHEEPGKGWWVGRDIAQILIDRAHALGITLRCGQSVHGLEQRDGRWSIFTNGGIIHADRLLLATGASEVACPLPGWTLPGVMSIGAAQVMTNVHYVKPGQRGLIVGVNVLAMAIARELAVSGVEIAGIVLPGPSPFAGESARPASVFKTIARLSHLAPSALMRIGGQLATRLGLTNLVVRFLPRKGVQVWGIPLQLRTAATEVHGDTEVQSVTLVDLQADGTPIQGTERNVEVDFVAIAGCLSPLVELASVAGCPFTYVPELGGHIPLHDETLRTPLAGLYLAGNITGVESAQVAMAQGRLAATAICEDAGILGDEVQAKSLILAALQDVRDKRANGLIQFHPDIAAARAALYQHSAG